MHLARNEKFNALSGLLRCPVCQKTLNRESDASLTCSSGHCFDLGKKGYLNLAPERKRRLYDAALFESRQRVFRAGFYKAPLSLLCETASRFVKSEAPLIVDAGCGEGYYALGVHDFYKGRAHVVGFDIEREAILLAARGGNDVAWLVADLARIPLADACADAVLNVFSPANYGEFRRVLKPGGIVIKAVPGEHYLKEIRQAAKGLLKSEAYSPERVTEHFEEHLKLTERLRVTNTLRVTREQLNDFLSMTPMMFGINTETLNVEGIDAITVDVELLVGRE